MYPGTYLALLKPTIWYFIITQPRRYWGYFYPTVAFWLPESAHRDADIGHISHFPPWHSFWSWRELSIYSILAILRLWSLPLTKPPLLVILAFYVSCRSCSHCSFWYPHRMSSSLVRFVTHGECTSDTSWRTYVLGGHTCCLSCLRQILSLQDVISEPFQV